MGRKWRIEFQPMQCDCLADLPIQMLSRLGARSLARCSSRWAHLCCAHSCARLDPNLCAPMPTDARRRARVEMSPRKLKTETETKTKTKTQLNPLGTATSLRCDCDRRARTWRTCDLTCARASSSLRVFAFSRFRVFASLLPLARATASSSSSWSLSPPPLSQLRVSRSGARSLACNPCAD